MKVALVRRPTLARSRVARAVGLSLFCSMRLVNAQEAAAEAASAPAAPPALGPRVSRKSLPQLADYNASSSKRNAGNYLWPLVDIVGINLSLWAVPYASGSPFVKVNPSIWEEHFRAGPQWDDGEFEVNQLGHPYQGSMYFSAARVHGLSFWEAAPYTLAGSWMWEYFMETEQPSTSDFLTTTFGGTFLGETLYRLSNAIRNDSASGSTRVLREIAAFAVNPVSGLDRVFTGKAWAAGPAGITVPLSMNLRVGVDGLGQPESTGWGTTFRTRIRFDYGDPYAKSRVTTPFEVFHLALQLSVSDTIIGQGLDGTGVLLGRRFSAGPSQASLLAWVMSFQYFTNGTAQLLTRESAGVYQLGELGTGLGWFARWRLGAGFSVHSELDVLAVPSGAVTSPYAKYEANRIYNYGVGGALKLELSLRQERLGRLYARANSHLYAVVDGARGTDSVGDVELGAYANLSHGHGVGFNAIRYSRRSLYDNYPSVHDSFWSGAAHYELEF
jgi:hypothetical protein